jgi:hypothetical protein
MGEIVIAVYRPKPGQAEALAAEVRAHVPDLRAWGLATERPATAMRARDGTILEVFEWRDGGIEAAHKDPRVLAMWERFGAACDMISLRDVAETAQLFAGFAPLD